MERNHCDIFFLVSRVKHRPCHHSKYDKGGTRSHCLTTPPGLLVVLLRMVVWIKEENRTSERVMGEIWLQLTLSTSSYIVDHKVHGGREDHCGPGIVAEMIETNWNQIMTTTVPRQSISVCTFRMEHSTQYPPRFFDDRAGGLSQQEKIKRVIYGRRARILTKNNDKCR
jgi:hypothetical protein